MKFYEYFAKPNPENPEELKQFLEFAKKMDFSGIGIIKTESMDTEKYIEIIKKIKKEVVIDIVSVFEIAKSNQLKNVRQIRGGFEVIVAKNMGLEANRVAIETEGVDVLLSPYTPEYISFNYVMAKLAMENGVAIGFSLKDLIFTDKKTRASLFRNMLEAARFAKKAGCGILLTTEAITQWELRGCSELISFGRVLGFQDPATKKGISEKLVEINREKLKNV